MIDGQLETVPVRIGKCSAIMWILWKEYHHFLWISTIILWTSEMGQYHEMNSKENGFIPIG